MKTNLRSDTRKSIFAATVAILLLLLASAAVLKAIKAEFRSNVSSHILSQRDTMVQLLDLMNVDAMARVRTIVEEPQLKDFARALTRAPGHAALGHKFAAWITPIYQSRGFEGYALISADTLAIVATGSPAYIGRRVAPQTAAAIREAEQSGAAIARPLPTDLPVVSFGVERGSGAPAQLVCARITEEQMLLGYLCLRDNPAVRLYRLLEAGRPGITGESYVIDAEGRILSPIRFESKLAGPPGASPGWSLFNVFAREPLRGSATPRASNAAITPLTRTAAALIERGGATGLIEDYVDYRGGRVVGAGQWVPAMQMGLIIEQDMAEAYRSFNFARLALAGLVAVAIVLIVALTVAQWRSRRSLARSEQQLAAFRDHIPAMMHMRDAGGRYVMVNPRFESIAGVPAARLLGRTADEIEHGNVRGLREAECEEVIRTGQPLMTNQAVRDASGAEIVYSVVRFPIRGEDGANILGVGTVGIDVTEQVKAQRELEELSRTLEKRVAERTAELAAARDEAQAASQAKARFLANMSHEIRTPLNAVIGMSHLAAQANTDGRVARYLQRIHSSSHHLLGIVSDILDLSRIEAGKLAIDVSEFSIDHALRHVSGLVAETARSKGLRLLIRIERGVPERVHGDLTRLAQIMINFANNAVKFTERGEVVLRVRCLGREDRHVRLVFEVADTGIGIAQEKLALLFRPFQQLDGGMARRFEGSGLGLAISKSLAELMGGRVAVASVEGRGSVFSLEIALPVAAADESVEPGDLDSHRSPDGVAAPAVGGASHGWRGLAGRRVLVVEDNAINREVVHDLLELVGVHVTGVADGPAALRIAAEQRFDAILMDVNLPVMNGFEATAAFRAKALVPQTPIIAVTANALVGDRERCLAAGMDDYIAKPIEPDQLYAALARHCTSGQATPLPWTSSPATFAHDANSDVFAALSALPDLDVNDGVGRMMGRVELYVRFARRVARERADLPQRIETAARSGDRQALADLLHDAKSMLGVLGAARLRESCAGLEKKISDGEAVATAVAEFCEALSNMLALVSCATQVLEDDRTSVAASH